MQERVREFEQHKANMARGIEQLKANAEDANIARFFIIARVILDSFIIKKDPEAVSSDDRMRILVDEEDGLLQQTGVTLEDAVLAYTRLLGKASSSVHTVKTREACSVREAVKNNPLAIPQVSPQVVNIAEKMLLTVASVVSLEEGKASPGIVNGSYVDWRKAAVNRESRDFQYGMNLIKTARRYNTESEATEVEFGREEESGSEEEQSGSEENVSGSEEEEEK